MLFKLHYYILITVLHSNNTKLRRATCTLNNSQYVKYVKETDMEIDNFSTMCFK